MDIDQLIKKFYDGVSTPEEERFLMDFFLHTTDIDARWKTDQRLFRALHAEAPVMAEDVSRRLEVMIDEMSASSSKPVVKRRRLFYRIASVAAVILVCIGLFVFTQQTASDVRMADTFEDPAEAALVAEEALVFMSSYLNQGLNEVADAEQKIEKVNGVLDKFLK